MRSVRCDACGTKALMAASQCPKCGHLFEVRDGSGELLPLAHCPSCDAYYPAHVHSCKWCGTTLLPEKPRKRDGDTLRWVAGGVLGVAVLLGLLARDPTPKVSPRTRASVQAKSKAAAPAGAPVRDTVIAASITTDSGETVRVAVPVVTDVSAPLPSAPAAVDTVVISQTRSAPADAATIQAIAPSHVTSTPPRERRTSTPWVGMVARQWVIVRADAQRSARIVASVGPNSRVQLGEARGSWRRIKLHGIAGWVDVSNASFTAARSARTHSSSHIASTLKR